MEMADCEHTETIEKGLGTVSVATCDRCGQVRQFKEGDEWSNVITEIGRVGDKIVMPKPGQRLDITPEEHRLVKEGFDILQADREFQKKMQALSRAREAKEAEADETPVERETETEEAKIETEEPQTETEEGKVETEEPQTETSEPTPELKGWDLYWDKRRAEEAEAKTEEAPSPEEYLASQPEPETVEEVKEETVEQKEKSLKPAGWAKLTHTERGFWYDDHREEIEKDLAGMKPTAVEEKWEMTHSTHLQLIAKWKRHDADPASRPTYSPPNGKPLTLPARWGTLGNQEKARWFQHHRGSITAEIKETSPLATRKRMGINENTMRTLVIRWNLQESAPEPPEKEPESGFVRIRLTNLPPFPDFDRFWSPDVQVRWLEIWKDLYDARESVMAEIDEIGREPAKEEAEER